MGALPADREASGQVPLTPRRPHASDQERRAGYTTQLPERHNSRKGAVRWTAWQMDKADV